MGVYVWWVSLASIGILNIAAWVFTARKVWRLETSEPSMSEGTSEDRQRRTSRRAQLLLSAAFVFVCALRSILPRADVQRICLYDSWWSSVALGRSAATIAELCFVAQWALWLRDATRNADAPFAAAVSRVLLPLIATAELFSWYATLTTAYIGNAIEESLWAVAATLATLAVLSIRSRVSEPHQRFLRSAIGMGVGYVLFMCTVDVPMYVSRWFTDQAAARPYFSLTAGMADVGQRWVVTHSWADWNTEMAWMTLYFSAAVWASLALVLAPRLGALAPRETARLGTRLTRWLRVDRSTAR